MQNSSKRGGRQCEKVKRGLEEQGQNCKTGKQFGYRRQNWCKEWRKEWELWSVKETHGHGRDRTAAVYQWESRRHAIRTGSKRMRYMWKEQSEESVAT